MPKLRKRWNGLRCCFCNKAVNEFRDDFGHSPAPFPANSPAIHAKAKPHASLGLRACTKCNEDKVIPVRIGTRIYGCSFNSDGMIVSPDGVPY